MPNPSSARRRRLPGRSRGLPFLAAALVLAASLVPAAEVSAQGADRNRMTEGDSVRVRLTGRMTVSAVFSEWQTNGILLAVDGFVDPYQVELENLERLDVFMARTPSESFRHGALLGGTAGIFIGAVAGVILHAGGVIADESGPPSEVVTDALSFAGIGLVGGVLVGGFYASSHPGSGWIRVQVPTS